MRPSNRYALASTTAGLVFVAAATGLFLAFPSHGRLITVGALVLAFPFRTVTRRLVPHCPYCGAEAIKWTSAFDLRGYVVDECPRCGQPLQGPRLTDAELEARQWRRLEGADPKYARLLREELSESGQSVREFLRKRDGGA